MDDVDIHVFVIDCQNAAVPIDKQGHVVVVVAKGERLAFSAAEAFGIEGRGTGPQGIASAHHRLP